MNIRSISISTNLLELLYTHAEQTFPLESVALLFGEFVEDTAIVQSVELMENVAKSPTRFEVDPVAEYNLLVRAEELGMTLVGIFHSHPAPLRPSSSDINNMKLNPVVWLIANNLSGAWQSKSFVLRNGSVDEIAMIVS